MNITYAIIGLIPKFSAELISYSSRLPGHRLVGNSENPEKLHDIILGYSHNLIYINVNQYSSKDFNKLSSNIDDLYRSIPQKPLLVALASSKE